MSENSSMLRNAFAAVGVIVVTVKAVEVFKTHIQAPMEKRLADIFTDEQEQAAAARAATDLEWNLAIDAALNKIYSSVSNAALAEGATPDQAKAAGSAAVAQMRTCYRS